VDSDWTRRKSIDKTATEAEKFVPPDGSRTMATGRGIPVDSPDERLIDIAPEVGFIGGPGRPPIA